MTEKEARGKLLKQYPNKSVKKFVEYKGYYVYLLVPKDAPNRRVMDAMYGVEILTGDIAAYQPTNDKNFKNFFDLWRKAKEV